MTTKNRHSADKKDPKIKSKLFESKVHRINYASIFTGDSSLILDGIEEESVQLVITSPPYNIGKEYETQCRLSLEEYLEQVGLIIEKLYKKLRNGGSICWQVGNYIAKGEVYPLDYFFYEKFKTLNMKLRNRIIWKFNFGLHASRRLSGRYETLLWFTKGDNYKFNLDPIRIPQLYPGKRHSSKRGKKSGTPSGNPLGKNPSDFWEFSASNSFIENPVWELPNLKANHPEKTFHPCQFPIELAERCILAFTDENDTILDPFVGSGTSLIAASKHSRYSIGIDKDIQYAELACERLTQFYDGILPMRESGKRLQKPKENERVAEIPPEWKQLERSY